MGLFDKANLDKAKALFDKNRGTITQTVTKATSTIDDKTGGKYRQHLEKVDDAAHKYVGTGEDAEPESTEASDEPTPG